MTNYFLALYLIPTNWVSFALLLIEPTRSTTHGWVSTKTSRNSLKPLKRIFFQPIWFKGCQSVPHAHRDECDPPVSVSDTTTNFYFKLPYIGSFSFVTQKRVRQFAKCYCNNIDVKLAFSSFKIGDMFGLKDPIPRGLRTCVVYKFLCASCNACYVGETPRQLSTRVREHLISDGTSHIFRYLFNSPQCRTLCSDECCNTSDHAATTFQLKIKEKTITK